MKYLTDFISHHHRLKQDGCRLGQRFVNDYIKSNVHDSESTMLETRLLFFQQCDDTAIRTIEQMLLNMQYYDTLGLLLPPKKKAP